MSEVIRTKSERRLLLPLLYSLSLSLAALTGCGTPIADWTGIYCSEKSCSETSLKMKRQGIIRKPANGDEIPASCPKTEYDTTSTWLYSDPKGNPKYLYQTETWYLKSGTCNITVRQ